MSNPFAAVLLAMQVATPTPGPTPTTYATTVPAAVATAAPYVPAKCVDVIRAAHLVGRIIDADTLGALFASLLRRHGVVYQTAVDSHGAPVKIAPTIPADAIVKSELDLNACFRRPG